ncbi:TPA: IclR family transcriptional regulator [Campylobacter lari]|uniref:IclR family transcriptional regulator n=1 Tax=Campylobacter TaxID=194 RepID=UPI0010597850|nr:MULTISPECIES: IclR family transcriptional regulator [Campylobacter]EAI4441775.1 IclR family transcriptional regulator [Campylobacter lari]EAL5903260.1 IclR family transcriptional regulator [Campylobacter lari]MCV3409852.1 IclR family transcriptional regulator [Campylobacter sp. IFREMER_LSEM_CL1890]TDJ89218.1 IclR family transcriptional regulator [Campylobacter lari]HEC1755965.1 IclR family transcriptional regulator [Campylobacter lari]
MTHQPTLRVLKILELLGNNNQKNTLSSIAKDLNIPPGTLSPILQTLQAKNYIKCDKNKFYTLDYKILEISRCISIKNSALELIKKHMKNIRNLTGQTCQMGILKEGNVFYLEKLDSDNQIQIKSFVGASYPAYATSLGKALLEKKTYKELEKIYPNPFEKITSNTLNNLKELYEELSSIKENKIALESGEMNPEIECMAIGIEYDEKIIAAISISYHIFYSNANFKEKNQKILLEEKYKIEQDLKLYFPELENIYQ